MSGPALFRPSSIPSGLKGYWKFDEASGSRADSSGNNNNLTDNNTVMSSATDYWKTGENSADFELSNSEFLSLTHAAQTGLGLTGGAFTIAASIKMESNASSCVIMAKYSTAAKGYFFDVNAGTLRLGVSSDGSALTVASSVSTLSVAKNYFVAAVYTGSQLLLYIDGNLDSVTTYSSGVYATGADVYVGAIYTTLAANFYDGLIKDLAAWNVALTPVQIKSLALGVDLDTYAYRPNKVSTLPTAWWKLNEVSGTRYDSIGSLHLTDNNTVGALGGYAEGVGADFELGNSEYLSCADAAAFNLAANDFTLYGQFKFESIATTQALFGQWSSASSQFGWFLQFASTNNIQFVWTNDGVTTEFKSFAFTPVVGVLYHITARRSGNNLTVWVDGVQIGTTQSLSGETIFNSSADFTISSQFNGSRIQFYDGVATDVAIWNGYALTDAEIKSLACGIPLQRSGIVMYLKMNQSSGNETAEIGGQVLVENGTGGIGTGLGVVDGARLLQKADTDYFQLANASLGDLNGTDDYSVFCWIKPTTSTAVGVIAELEQNKQWYLAIESANTITSYDRCGSNTSALTIADGSWGHAGASFDGVGNKVWVNSASQFLAGAFPPQASSQNLRIGCRPNPAGNNPLDASIDEFIFAKRWFRDEEVKTIYCKGLCGKELISEELSAGDFFLML